MSGAVAVLDACALVPIRLASTLLWFAESGLFQPLWSEPILDEVYRSLPKVGVPPEDARRRIAMMREAFGAEALVDEFDDLIDEMACDPKDRHVLAAAVRGGADTVVTFNLKDFPDEGAATHGIEILHPDSFLIGLFGGHAETAVSALERQTAAFQHPPQTVTEFLASLTATVPMFANLAADALVDPPGPVAPVPALVMSDDKAGIAALGEAGDMTNPAQVAFGWWAGLLDDLDSLPRPHVRPPRVGRLSMGSGPPRRTVLGVEGAPGRRRSRPDRIHAVRSGSQLGVPGVRGVPDSRDVLDPDQSGRRNVAGLGARSRHPRCPRHPVALRIPALDSRTARSASMRSPTTPRPHR